MADSSTDSIGSCSAEKLDQTTRDIFQGNALIDRLLVYFSKFEGRREKARTYAQKLLDLGHIESLGQSSSFEDSIHEYRWTDVARMVNKAKAQSQENVANSTNLDSEGIYDTPHLFSVTVHQKERRPTVKISIEADNFDGTVIQAHITTDPTPVPMTSTTQRATKSGDTICLAEVQNSRMTSFMTETSSKAEEVLRMVPVSAASEKRSLIHNSSTSEDHPVDGCIITPEYRENSILDPISEKKKAPHHDSGVNSAIEIDKSTSTEETSLIGRKSSTLGKVETSPVRSPFFESKSRGRLRFLLPEDQTRKHAEDRENPKQNHQIDSKWDSPEEILYKEGEEIPRHHTSRSDDSLSHSSVQQAENYGKPVTASGTGLGEADNYSTPAHSRKFNFKEDSDWIRMRREYLEHEEIRQSTERSNDQQQQVALFDNPDLSFHSTGSHDTIEEVPEPQTNITQEIRQEELVKKDHIVPPIIKISSPPSTPTCPRKSSDQGVKSLFWTKITCDASSSDEMEGIFWLNLEKRVQFNEDEFTSLFSKPLPSALQKSSRRILQEDASGSKTLKVLGTERSRQVAIRASSIRLQADDIHDAIINMDDSMLDLDSLEALYDVRPAADELDDIADALKRNPNGILDKPEQFVLMLAMLNNLDERLKSWIFVKKLPDKVLDIKEQLNTLSSVCIQIVRNPTLQQLLEATLVLGNFMNKDTQRGNAVGYILDILPKLKDVKSQGGETNLMQYLVKWLIAERENAIKTPDIMQRQESKASTEDPQYNNCGLPNQASLQKACAINLQDVLEDVDGLAADLNECKEKLIPAVIEGATCMPEIKPFRERMNDFIKQAEKAIAELQSLSSETSKIADEFRRYFVPGDMKSESLTNMVKHITLFCDGIRNYWDEEKRNVAKEASFNTEKARRQRMAAVKIAKSPSALKARFLEKKRRERGSGSGENVRSTMIGNRPSTQDHRLLQNELERIPGRSHCRHRTKKDVNEIATSQSHLRRGVVEANVEIQETRRQPTSVLFQTIAPPRQNHVVVNGRTGGSSFIRSEKLNSVAGRNSQGQESANIPTGLSKMKQVILKRQMLLKSKTC